MSEPAAPPRSSGGLRFASGHPYGSSRGYRSFRSGFEMLPAHLPELSPAIFWQPKVCLFACAVQAKRYKQKKGVHLTFDQLINAAVCRLDVFLLQSVRAAGETIPQSFLHKDLQQSIEQSSQNVTKCILCMSYPCCVIQQALNPTSCFTTYISYVYNTSTSCFCKALIALPAVLAMAAV